MQLDGVRHLVLVDATSPVVVLRLSRASASDLVPDGLHGPPVAGPADDAAGAARAPWRPDSGLRPARPARQDPAAPPVSPTGPLTAQTVVPGARRPAARGRHRLRRGQHRRPLRARRDRRRPAPRLALPHRRGHRPGPARSPSAPPSPARTAGCCARGRRQRAVHRPGAAGPMAREGLDVTTVVLNNRSYAMLNMELDRVGAETPGPGRGRCSTSAGRTSTSRGSPPGSGSTRRTGRDGRRVRQRARPRARHTGTEPRRGGRPLAPLRPAEPGCDQGGLRLPLTAQKGNESAWTVTSSSNMRRHDASSDGESGSRRRASKAGPGRPVRAALTTRSCSSIWVRMNSASGSTIGGIAVGTIPSPSDRGGNLDDGPFGQVGDVPPVRDVDRVEVARSTRPHGPDDGEDLLGRAAGPVHRQVRDPVAVAGHQPLHRRARRPGGSRRAPGATRRPPGRRGRTRRCGCRPSRAAARTHGTCGRPVARSICSTASCDQRHLASCGPSR